ncbi:solute carrier family 25 member 35-like isoform X2 [Phlebotomus argentipes]|nr:solute carrier family 25 member 35-like isoform X2 [Phlebotomus argentipes]
MDFVIGGAAACSAGIFTNPLDLIKTRQQLHGELDRAKPRGHQNPYRNIFTSVRTIVKTDGILGLQKGLAPALGFQLVMNSTRLGLYDTFDKLGWTRGKSGHHSPFLLVFWGGFSGATGSVLATPLYLVKTQIQAMSSGDAAVGHQHQHRGMLDAFRTIYKDSGVAGLWRGSVAILCRTAVGSSVQLSTFTACKDFCHKYEIFHNSVFLTACSASVVSGFLMVCCMTPLDVISTRLFNQGVDEKGRGLLYRNIFDCFLKTFKCEGLRGLYKGFRPMFYRAAPHTILNLTFWDMFKKWKGLYFSLD